MIYGFKTVDHPEADGREPVTGEQKWLFWFPLQDHGTLYLEMGLAGLANLAGLIDEARAKGQLPAAPKVKRGRQGG